jgi:DNA-binding HxlR family transcriptional regulator
VDKLSLTFAALADPTRRAILERLLRGDATVNELAKPFDLRLPTVSKHLKVLQRAGLVSQSRKGNWRPRRLESAPLEEVARWAERFRANRQDQPRQKFLCLICADRLLEQMSEAEAKKHLAQYRVLTDDLRKRGQLLGCNRLLTADTATTVRVRKGRVSRSDGPFAETKELIGGYFLVEAKDRTEAVRIAGRIPGARIGCVEVRPIADDPGTLRALGLA